MWANPYTAGDAMERRYEFVSEGAETTRWLAQFVSEGFRAYRDHLFQAASIALLSLGSWLAQRHLLRSVNS